ncbi:Hypothetical predicted protein, partial [Paramuricea clavata]
PSYSTYVGHCYFRLFYDDSGDCNNLVSCFICLVFCDNILGKTVNAPRTVSLPFDWKPTRIGSVQ